MVVYIRRIYQLGDGVFDVLAATGDNKLGGDDFDQKSSAAMAEFKKENGIDLSNDKDGSSTVGARRGWKSRKTFLV